MKKTNEEVKEMLREFAASRRKPVIMSSIYTYFPLKYFESIKVASEETGIARKSIQLACDGIYTRAGLYKWSWV